MLQNPALVGENTLLRENGERVTLLEVMGDAQLMLVFFGFTRCPDVCPITMARLAKIKHDTDAMDGVRMVMITVDPEHDTPEVMARYVQGFHPDFIGLSGSNSDIATTARSFYVGYADLGGGQWTHTEAVAVVDRQGRLRYVYGNDKVPQLEIDLPQLKRAL
jgi:protein SCO1/2